MASIQRKLLSFGGVSVAIYATIELWRWTRYRKLNEEIIECIFTRDESDMAERSEVLAKLYKDIPGGPMRHCNMIERLLDSARHSINMSMYIFTSNSLCNALIRAHERGVIVRLIIEKSMEGSSNSQIKKLVKQKIPVRVETKHTMHHKFVLIDVPHECNRGQGPNEIYDWPFYVPNSGLLLTGSLNFTMEALTKNHENIILTSNKRLIKTYMDNFLVLWNELNPDDKKVTYF